MTGGKYPGEIYKKQLIKPFVEWYLGNFGAAKSVEMYEYARKNGLFTRGYAPKPQVFVENIVGKCKGRICNYDSETCLWSLMKHPKTNKEWFMERYAARESC